MVPILSEMDKPVMRIFYGALEAVWFDLLTDQFLFHIHSNRRPAPNLQHQ